MNRISAPQFWELFAKHLRVGIDGQWPAIYTNARWTPVISSTCRSVGIDLGFIGSRELCAEYMKIDFSFFKIGDESGGLKYCHWDWEVAIEFENNSQSWDDWLEEVTRLTHLNAGLKVLITYADYRNCGCEHALKKARGVYQARRYHQSDDRWLFIFGPWSKYLNLPGAEFVAFAWDGVGDFLPLQHYSIIPRKLD